MKNNSFEEIAKQLNDAKSVLVYPHVNMDGDAVGSAVAICKALRDMGKTCYILLEDKIPGNLKFLDKGYFTWDQEIIQSPDVSICVDCGELERFPARKDAFLKGKTTICIDHHRTSKAFCDFNYIDPKAAATGELIYRLLTIMGINSSGEIGEALFTAITTDTGNFQYSNTTKECHLIAAELCDLGIDTNRVSIEIYENVRLEKLLLKCRALDTLEMLCNGKAAIVYVTEEMLKKTGATPDETEGIIDEVRCIEGVEIAAFLKESRKDVIKLSMRAKTWANVAEIAESIGGGGHIKAAGGTLNMTMEEAIALTKKKIEGALGDFND